MGGIGESLRSAREAKGITLNQAEEDTKIRKRYLQALEDGEYDVIPGRVYAKGFLRNYANYLGLDQEEVMLEYKLLGVPVKEEYKRVDIEASINKKRRSVGRSDRKTYLVTVLIAVFAVLILVVYNFAFRNTSENIANEDTTQPNTEQSDQSTEPGKTGDKSADKSAGQPPAKQPEAPQGNSASQPQNGGSAGTDGTSGADGTVGQNATGVNLTLKGQNEVCWVRVTVDGIVKFTGNLNPGESKTYTGTGNIKVRVGNAGAVEATFNGQNLGKLGILGQPVTREFSAASGTASGGASGVQNASGGQR